MPSAQMTKARIRSRRKVRGGYSMDLPAHMAECDANYLRFLKLFPDLRERDEVTFTLELHGASFEVRFAVLERSPYTSLVRVSQCPEVPWNVTASLTVRLYHDARSAEVVEYQGRKHFLRAVYDYPNQDMRQPDEKAQINRFLGEFLSLCLRHGMAAGQPLLAN